MQYNFLNIFLDPKELLVQSKIEINPYLLENNTSQIKQIYDFFKSNLNLLFVNGFLGTGKVEIVNYSTSFLSDETIILKYDCFNSTVLDDILLSFFNDFKNLSAQNIISEPKIRTENFTQKINSYFSQVEKPFVIILDSFEEILEENRQEIIDFILHLNSMQKTKIIIIGRVFEGKYFQDTNIARVTTLALEKQIFEKYIKSKKIKASNLIIDEFYKHTRGYYFFTTLSIILMQKQNITLVDFLMNLKNSYLPFHNFLEKQALTLVPATERNLFLFLCLIRHSVNIELLKKLNFCDDEKLNNLIQNRIITQEGSNIYVQDYFKDEIDSTISSNILQKIRQYIIDLYETQLPLKPLERNICISRQTMRKEIEYHKLFLPKKPKSTTSPNVDINYLSYSKVFDFTEKPKLEDENTEQQKIGTSQIDLTQRKNISIPLENLPFQSKSEALVQKEKEEYENGSIKDILALIKQYRKQYSYAEIIGLCQNALLMKKDEEYQLYLPVIYTKMAFAYNKLAEYENSFKYYELAKEFYENSKNFLKVNYIKFNIAKILYETYKFEPAKELFLEVATAQDSTPILRAKSYIKLANLEEDSSGGQKQPEYYKLALEYSGEIMDIEILSELYFNYALIMDDKNDVKTAIEFYNKCINLGEDTKQNKFLSSAYSNIATLYLEKHDITNAIKTYTKAYEFDKQTDNLEGIYYSSSKLASILQNKHSEKALEYFNIALDCANQIKDVFYIISASLAIGDYHYDKKQNEIALKYYLKALDKAQDNLSSDNIYKINMRINDIKFRLGVEKFDKIVEIIKMQEDLR